MDQLDDSKNKVSSDQPEIPACRQAGPLIKLARNDRIKIIVLSLTIVLSIISILFAKSVGASLGVGAGLVVFALLINKKVRWVTIAILVVTTLGVSSYQPARHKALEYITLNDFSGQVRRAQWRETITMLKDKNHWLLGAGLSNYQTTIMPYHVSGFFVENYNDPNSHRKLVFDPVYRDAHWQPLEIFMYPHNIILNFWTELGLSGVLLFVWMIIKFLYLGFKNLNSEYRAAVAALMAVMVAIVIHGLVDVPYFKNDLAVMFWLWLVVMALIDLKNKKIIS